MNRRRQQQPKTANITCDGCGKITSRSNAFFMFDFECCSNECMEPFHKQQQAELKAREDERDSKRSRDGAFNMCDGGGNAY